MAALVRKLDRQAGPCMHAAARAGSIICGMMSPYRRIALPNARAALAPIVLYTDYLKKKIRKHVAHPSIMCSKLGAAFPTWMIEKPIG